MELSFEVKFRNIIKQLHIKAAEDAKNSDCTECYDDHGGYYEQGYADGLEMVLGLFINNYK